MSGQRLAVESYKEQDARVLAEYLTRYPSGDASGEFEEGCGMKKSSVTGFIFALSVFAPAMAQSPPDVKKLPQWSLPRTWPVLELKLRFLTRTTDFYDYDHQFSPDGKMVLFSRTADGDNSHSEFYIMPVAGGEPKKLSAQRPTVGETRPVWSPSGKLIAFTAFPLNSAGPGLGTWLINTDGTGAHALAAGGLSNQTLYPSWYPDGEHIAVTDYSTRVLKKIDLKSGQTIDLTDPAKILPGMASVSPDGKWIAFAGHNIGQTDFINVIWLTDDSGQFRTLENPPIAGRTPAWSPDGKKVVFESDRGNPDGRYAVFVVNSDGTGLEQITDYTLNADHPVFSPDGKHILFSYGDYAKGPPPYSQPNGIAIIDLP